MLMILDGLYCVYGYVFGLEGMLIVLFYFYYDV